MKWIKLTSIVEERNHDGSEADIDGPEGRRMNRRWTQMDVKERRLGWESNEHG